MGLGTDRHLAPGGRPQEPESPCSPDAFSCTNPSLGHGISLGLMHARCLRDTVSSIDDDPVAFAKPGIPSPRPS